MNPIKGMREALLSSSSDKHRDKDKDGKHKDKDHDKGGKDKKGHTDSPKRERESKSAGAKASPRSSAGGIKESVPEKKGSVRSVRAAKSGAFSAEVLDGRKVKALLKDEKEFTTFLDKYFDMLDKDSGGTLTRNELKPALVRFGSLLGLPSPGTTAEADDMVDALFTALMSGDLSEEIDKPTFINISRNFLASVASNLEEKPLVVHVFDGSVLQELAENEDLFDAMVEDFFQQFDEDESGRLARDEILPALVALGLVPPQGSKPEADALLSRILGKYGGTDLELDRGEFKHMLRDLLKELSEELTRMPIVVGTESLPVMTAPALRKLVKDPQRLKSLGDVTFQEWDTLKKGRITRTDVIIGFKEMCQLYGVPVADEEQAEVMCVSSCIFMNADQDGTGFVERVEFDPLLQELLTKLADRLQKNPTAAAAATTQASAGWFGDWFRQDSVKAEEEEEAKKAAPPADHHKPAAPPPAKPAAAAAAAAAAAVPASSSGKKNKVPSKARTAAEIKAAYNYKASDAVLQAREKLEERQRKLQEMASRGEELEADAADFEDLSKQLAEKMKKKWW